MLEGQFILQMGNRKLDIIYLEFGRLGAQDFGY